MTSMGASSQRPSATKILAVADRACAGAGLPLHDRLGAALDGEMGVDNNGMQKLKLARTVGDIK